MIAQHHGRGTRHTYNAAARQFQSPTGTDWHVDAACARLPLDIVDELFYPPIHHRIESTVKRLCAECPVLTQCTEAGRSEEYGVWGGVGGRQRKQARSRHEAA